MEITVRQLIEELQKADPDQKISFQIYDGCCGDIDFLDLNTAETLEFPDGSKPFIIRFDAQKGFETCMKSGATKRFIDSLYKDKT